ncbi:MAG: hypothetical protein II221_03645, partial [Paludibacteraceae bacterium]|nr:hypothetical protein [Paludibacteraceae bacterium]
IVNGRAYTNSQLAKLNAEVEAEVVKLEKLQGQLQQYTTGKTGQQKYLPDWDIAGQYEEAAAASLEWLELLEEERKQVAATAAARIESAEAAKQADQERYQAWLKETYSKEQADRQDARDREAAADAKRYQDWLKQKDKEAQQAEALEDKKWAAMRQSVAKGHQAAQALEEKRYQKWLEQKHKEVQESKRLENAKWAATEQAIRAQNSTYKGALDLSQSAKSINQRIEAVKYLKIARESLSETDARYTQKVQALNKALSNQQLAIDRLREKSEILKNSHSNLLDISGQLARRLALVFSVSQMTGYFNKLVQVRGELELQQKALQAILQNKRQADELWEKTVQLAVRSPYQIKDLVTYTKQLAAYRVETEKLHDTTKMLADVSSGLGVDMQRLILAYGQVKAANYLRGTELRQFSEAGINILGELATYFSEIESKGVSVAEVFDRVSKRMVTFADVEEIFKRITSAGGIFYKMQETQAETLKGQISNLKDAITVMLNEIGEANEGTLKFGVSLTRSMIENWRAIPPILTAVVSGLTMAKVASLSTRESIIRSALSLNVISDWGTEQLSLQQLLVVGGRKVVDSFKNFASFFTASGPAAIIVAAITAIAAGIADIVKYRIELRGITKEFEQMRKPVTDLAASMTVASWTGDIKKATTALAQLTKLAQEQYFIEVGFTAADLNSMDLAEIESTFAELQHRVFSASRFAEEFAKEMARTQQLQQWEFWSQGLTTALTDVGKTG